MKVAAYQAPLQPPGSMAALDLIERKVRWCEAEAVRLLVCPEAILGGLADDATGPEHFAIRADNGQLASVLAPLASATVTSIIGFTEITADGVLYNSAAILSNGAVAGVYRKRHPAIRQSAYRPGTTPAVFAASGIRLGLMICNDSNFPEHAVDLAAQGADVILIPTNNALRPAMADVVEAVRRVDSALARATGLPVIRADVAGRSIDRLSFGSSGITDIRGSHRAIAQSCKEAMLVECLSDLR